MKQVIFFILLLIGNIAMGAVNAATVWEIRSNATAGNVNGCGFDNTKAGTDFSQQTGSQYSGTNLASTNGTTNPCVVTSATHNFVTADEGNLIHITAGTNWTAGWYEIVSTSANAATLDRACGAAASISGGTFAVGGACSLGSTTAGSSDANLFNSCTPGNSYYMKNGSYTGTATNITAVATIQNNCKIIGYNSTRTDAPTGSTRPTWALGTNTLTLGGLGWNLAYLIITGNATNVVNSTSGVFVFQFNKVVNNSTTANRMALNWSSASNLISDNEFISYRGIATSGANAGNLYRNYIHDSDVCHSNTGANGTYNFVNNIFEGCVTDAIINSTAITGTGVMNIENNTFYGAENKLGIGVSLLTTSGNIHMSSNIFYGFVTGVSFADSGTTFAVSDFNDYFNNTTARTNWPTGANDKALNPLFKSVAQVTVTTATTSNTGNTLVKSGATFITNGVTAGRDYVYISSTSGTVGIYGITSVDSETQITLDLAPGNSTGNVTAQITTGHNFQIGTPLKALGLPSAFPGGLTQSYVDIGAVQRREPVPSLIGGSRAH